MVEELGNFVADVMAVMKDNLKVVMLVIQLERLLVVSRATPSVDKSDLQWVVKMVEPKDNFEVGERAAKLVEKWVG